MSACTPEHEIAALRRLVEQLAVEKAELQRQLAASTGNPAADEDGLVKVVERELERFGEGWKPDGGQARLLARLRPLLRGGIRAHFAREA